MTICTLWPGIAAAQESPRATSWRATIEAESGWESNVRFLEPGGAGDRSAAMRGALQTTKRGRRGEVSVSALGEARMYSKLHDLNRFTYQVGANATRSLTQRLSGAMALLYRTSLSSETFAAATPGDGVGTTTPGSLGGRGLQLLPLSMTRTAEASAAASYRLDPVTSASVRVGYTDVTFDSPLLLPGRTGLASGTLSRLVRAGNALILQAEAQQGTTAGRALASRTVAIGWQSTAPWGSARLIGGGTLSSQAGQSSAAPSGQLEVRANVGRGAVLIRSARAVRQVLGLDQLLLVDQVDIGYERVTREGLVRLTGLRAWGAEPGNGVGEVRTTDAALELRRLLPSGITLGGALTYKDRTGDVRISGGGAHLSVGYVFGAP